MTDTKRQPKIVYILAILLLLSLLFVGYTSWRIVTQKPGESTVTSGGITVAKPSNNVKDATIDTNGDLVLKYEDGTERRVGNILGATGSTGPAPTQPEIALAVVNYCAEGRCDAKNPSTEQVAAAVYSYCSAGACKGERGADGSSATTEQVMAAVSQYCLDGRCTGPQGVQGVSGSNGLNPVMSCVSRTTNRQPTQYVAWKYQTEENTAYRDLYKLPTWVQGTDCVAL